MEVNAGVRLPRALAVVQVGLIFTSLPTFVAGVIGLFVERTPAALVLRLGIVGLAVGFALVFLRIYTNDRRWWFAALASPFVMVAFDLWDTFTYGDGRFHPFNLVLPAAVLICLLLPSVRAFYRPVDRQPATVETDGIAS